MQLPGLTLGIVADDLTGANDCALAFFKRGCITEILLKLEDVAFGTGEESPQQPPLVDDDVQVWSLNTNSRHATPEEAHDRVLQAAHVLMSRYGAENLYKKMDSTLRGHVARECLAMLDATGAECCIIVPAYPEQWRQTVGGYQLVRGLPLERTEVARDPLFPVSVSSVCDILAVGASSQEIGHIELSTVLRGAAPLVKAIQEKIQGGIKLLVVDACQSVDLEQIALAIEKVRKSNRVIPCGSAGLAIALSRYWPGRVTNPEGEGTPDPSTVDLGQPNPILVVSGSNSGTTRKQLHRLIEHYPFMGDESQLTVISLTPQHILGIESLETVLAQLIESLEGRNTTLITTALDESSLEETVSLGAEQQWNVGEVNQAALSILGQLVKRALEWKSVKLVLCGGETTYEVSRSIDSGSMRMIAEVEPAIPLLQDESGRWVVTKSGNFGEPMALNNIVRYLKGRESAEKGEKNEKSEDPTEPPLSD